MRTSEDMARKRALIRREVAHDYTVEILGRRYPVVDMVRAAQIVESIRDQNGYGASQMGSQFPIRDAGLIIGYVSYNGRVWAGQPQDSGTGRVHLVYDPSEKAHRDAYKVPSGVTPSRVVRNNPDLTQRQRDKVVSKAISATEKECRRRGIKAWSKAGTDYTAQAQESFNRAYDYYESTIWETRR
jgi:hypothetical protein